MPELPALIVFCRAPLPGRTKTRLIPSLGPDGAADLYRCFLLDLLTLADHMPADVIIAAAEEGDLPLVQPLVTAACPRGRLTVQMGADLGERMLNAFRQAFAAGHPGAVIIGTDAPSLPYGTVAEALAFSQSRDLVLGPCLDGGYYLIGMHRDLPELFAGIPWSTHRVLIETLTRARPMALGVTLLQPWYDVDEPRDLTVLHTHLTALSLAGEEITCLHTWQNLRAHAEELSSE